VLESLTVEGDVVTASMGTWAGTVLDGLFVDVFTYLP